MKFDNGESTRERWDGKDRWVRYVYHKKAKVDSVQIDPDYRSRWTAITSTTVSHHDRRHGATAKIATYWMFLTQFLAQMLSWLA